MVRLYDPGVRCPGCSGRNWLIGATTAECAGCGTALVVDAGLRPTTIMARRAGSAWRPGHFHNYAAPLPVRASAVVMARKGSGHWQRGGFAA